MKEEQFIRHVRRTGGSLCINIPLETVELLKLKDGDLVEIKIKKR